MLEFGCSELDLARLASRASVPLGRFYKNPGCTWLSLADTEIYKIKSWQRYGPNFDFNLLSGLASALNYFLLAYYFDMGLLGV